MPTTIRPTPDQVGVNKDSTVATNAASLKESSRAWTIPAYRARWNYSGRRVGEEDREILATSFTHDLNKATVIPYGNGFVDGIIRAFNQDLHLVLRPDDVWLAIMTQFGMFINGHAEDMRSHFVAHEGKKTLIVDFRPLGIRQVDMGKVAVEMTTEIQKNVVDPELREWMLPSFTTTTKNDAAVASFAMMGAMKHYFAYTFRGGCGFPSVALLGEKSDWESIAIRVKKLSRYGAEPSEWSNLLQPIVGRMVQSFETPESVQTKDFWLRACYEAGTAGSGTIMTLSGWITAFCFWDEDGKRIRAYSKEDLAMSEDKGPVDRRPLVLDGVSYPLISPESIPKAYISVPVAVQDFATGIQYNTTVMAGHVGVTSTEKHTKAQPLSGWWMLVDETKPIVLEEEEESQPRGMTEPQAFLPE